MTERANGNAANGDEPTDEPFEPSLADLLEDLAADFPDVTSETVPAGTDFVVGAQPFARLSGTTGHFRLRPEIAAAAVRTGDVTVSPIGRDWVAFNPKRLDQYALDRAQAWFELGHRLAGEVGGAHKRH